MTTPIADRPDGGARPPVPAPGPAERAAGRAEGGAGSGRLRQVAWASVPIWSLSLLAFVPFLRLALDRRRPRDWVVFAGYLAASIDRHQAREFAEHNLVLARDLRIGRPDLPHDYDDGGLVDVNQVPGDVLVSCLGLTGAESAAVVAARDQLGRFSSPEELTAYAELPPDRVEALRDWMMFS